MRIPNSRAEKALLLQRLLISGIIAAHGWSRWFAGGVEPFGAWLTTQGFPFGLAIAFAITVFEIVGTPLLAWGRFVSVLATCYAAIYFVGIILVHAPEGWFVVGLGRNGMEYSVLLIVCLLSSAYFHLPASRDGRNTETGV